jgi:hypothetical protein
MRLPLRHKDVRTAVAVEIGDREATRRRKRADRTRHLANAQETVVRGKPARAGDEPSLIPSSTGGDTNRHD